MDEVVTRCAWRLEGPGEAGILKWMNHRGLEPGESSWRENLRTGRMADLEM